MFCALLSQIKCSINICTMNGWMDRHMSVFGSWNLRVMEFFQCSYGTFRFLPNCVSRPWIQAGWGQRDRFWGAGGRRGEGGRDSGVHRGRALGNRPLLRSRPPDARCGHTALLWLELRTALPQLLEALWSRLRQNCGCVSMEMDFKCNIHTEF